MFAAMRRRLAIQLEEAQRNVSWLQRQLDDAEYVAGMDL